MSIPSLPRHHNYAAFAHLASQRPGLGVERSVALRETQTLRTRAGILVALASRVPLSWRGQSPREPGGFFLSSAFTRQLQ